MPHSAQSDRCHVDDKPKIVRQGYLGKIDDLVAAVESSRQQPQPLEADVAALGDSAALFSGMEPDV